jgi:hypothetical protein
MFPRTMSAHAAQVGSNTDSSNTVTLQKVMLTNLTSNSFRFV